ncbi:MAG TPA: hydrogenase iron-sulfur subunit [Burkholderiaceae bacterium]|nr:hydrogenase iron-sulfur subunit [Burkholderiaceae bacterium]
MWSLWHRLDRSVFDRAFGSRRNPLRHLGALGFASFVVMAASGIGLYAVLDTSASGAYRSIAEGGAIVGLMRSLHRYAADAFVILLALHALREALAGHTRFWRRWSWLSGVALIALVYASGIGGFWLHWDRLGQYSATATAEWLDALPLLATPLARNFLGAQAVSDRLFSLFVFVHIGVALLIALGLWLHVQRLSRPLVWPPRQLAVGFGLTLLALALLWPVRSDAPAALAQAPQALRLDWLLLFVHPMAEALGARPAWLVVAAAFAGLAALAFVPRRVRAPVAVVDPANCNGCRRCFADCPFAAIAMVPHPQRTMARELAVVDADLCASCGLCAGACPSSTPFRSAAELVTGIDLPQAPIGALRERLRRALAASIAERKIVVFGCDQGAAVEPLAAADVTALSLVCSGALPPSFVEYALRDGAAGVLVAACAEGGCEFRLGQRWTAERLQGAREPHLRASVPRERLELAWADRGDEGSLRAALQRLRERVSALAPEVSHA